MTIRIVTDSACDLPDDLVERYGIEIVPLNIRFGDEEYVDRFELDVTSFYDKLAHHAALPETSAPAPGRFAEAFEKQAAHELGVTDDTLLEQPVGGTPDSRRTRCVEWGGQKYPSLEDALDTAIDREDY